MNFRMRVPLGSVTFCLSNSFHLAFLDNEIPIILSWETGQTLYSNYTEMKARVERGQGSYQPLLKEDRSLELTGFSEVTVSKDNMGSD